MEKKIKVKCPICKTETIWQENPYKPFCSERCKLMDLGKWAEGAYNVESEDTPSSEGEMPTRPEDYN